GRRSGGVGGHDVRQREGNHRQAEEHKHEADQAPHQQANHGVSLTGEIGRRKTAAAVPPRHISSSSRPSPSDRYLKSSMGMLLRRSAPIMTLPAPRSRISQS